VLPAIIFSFTSPHNPCHAVFESITNKSYVALAEWDALMNRAVSIEEVKSSGQHNPEERWKYNVWV
jgi:hypothetical protein